MAEPIENKVTRSLKAAEELYHRLVLIVGKGGTGKTTVIQNLAKLIIPTLLISICAFLKSYLN